MLRVAVLDDYQEVAETSADWSDVANRVELDFLHEPLIDNPDAIEILTPYTAVCLMRERLPFDRTLIAKLPNLECIITTGTGNRVIDLAAARDHEVVVSGTTNGLGRVATAELAWGLILAAARHIPQEDRALRGGRWQTSLGTTLHGKTLGIIGLGGVGRHVARYARAFGMEVVAWSRNLTPEMAADSIVTAVGFDELLQISDFVSIHTVLGNETRGLIDASALSLMRPTAVLVNTSRGPIVDEAALIDVLRSHRIAGAALDVFDSEPLPADHPFLALENVVMTPHIGYVTSDVYGEFYTETVRSLSAWLDGKPIRVLDPELPTRRSAS